MKRAYGLWALLAAAACAPRPQSASPESATRGAEESTRPSGSASPLGLAPTVLDAGADGPPVDTEQLPTDPTSEDAEATSEDLPKDILLETPYRFGSRPVPQAAIAASVHDTELGAWNQGGRSEPGLASARPNFHPATRVILETQVLSGKGSLGGLGAGSILAQTRAQQYWPFRLCFESREAGRNGDPSTGAVVLRFSIDTRGGVPYARRMKSTLPADVAACARKAIYAAKFRPPPRRRVDVELTATLSRGDVELPARDVSPEPPKDESDAVAALHAIEPEVARCYLRGLRADAKLWGRVELRVQRDDAGTVVNAEELGSHFPDPSVTTCITRALIGRSVPASPGPDLVVAWRLGQWTPP